MTVAPPLGCAAQSFATVDLPDATECGDRLMEWIVFRCGGFGPNQEHAKTPRCIGGLEPQETKT